MYYSEKFMAPSLHKSTSPLTSRPNPNSKTLEHNSSARRSFSGNPFASKPSSIVAQPRSFNPTTPANSPSDFGRRNSFSKDNTVVSSGDYYYEHKENQKDLNTKPSVLRGKSPTVSKGTKNFMSPTISAASKFAASPRKKILTERDEEVRTPPISSSDENLFGFVNPSMSSVANAFLDSKPDMGGKTEASSNSKVTESEEKEVDLNPHASKKDTTFCSKVVPLSSSQTFSETSRSSSSSKSLSDVIAHLDADPSLPPYDPKTNYLSPRPQFLHYKPNPRIEAFLNKEREVVSEECRRLEEQFASECFSDTEDFEETESENSQEEYEDVVSSVEFIEEENNIHLPTDVSESESISTTDSTDVSEVNFIKTHLFDGSIEAKCVLRPPHLFARSKSIPLLLIFIVTCLSISVTDSPIISSSTFENQSSFPNLCHTPDMATFAKANLDGFAQAIQLWSAHSVTYFSKLVERLRKVDNLSPSLNGNFTASSEDHVIDKGTDERFKKNGVEDLVRDVEVEMGPSEEQGHHIIEGDVDIENALEGQGNKEEQYNLVVDEEEQTEKEISVAFQEPQNNIDFPDELIRKPLALEVDSKVSESVEHQVKNDLNSKAKHIEANDIVNALEEQANLVVHEAERTKEILGVALQPPQNIIDLQDELILTPLALEVDLEVSEAAEHQFKNDLNSKAKQIEVGDDIENDLDGQEQDYLVVHEAEDLGFKCPNVQISIQAPQNSIDFEGELIRMPWASEDNSKVSETIEHQDMDLLNSKAEQTIEASGVTLQAPQHSIDLQDELISTPQALEIDSEVSFAKIEPVQKDFNSELGNLDDASPSHNFQNFESADATTNFGSDDKYLNDKIMVAIFLLVLLTPFAATAITYMSRAKNTSKVAAPTGQPLLTKKFISGLKSPSVENTNQERLFYMNWPMGVDMVSDSSEMSSFQKSSSYGKRGLRGENGAHSYEKKPKRNYRRESLASSSSDHSMGSPSYGSFTTYEKITCKHGEEEIVTPVRRSSRIRGHVTSP